MPQEHFPSTQNIILSRVQIAGATNGPSLGSDVEDYIVKLEADGKIHPSFLPDQALSGVNFVPNSAFQSGALAPTLASLTGTWAIAAGTPSITYSAGVGDPLHGTSQLEMTSGDSVKIRLRVISEIPANEQPDWVFSFYAERDGTGGLDLTIEGEDGVGNADEILVTATPALVVGKTRFEYTFKVDPSVYTSGGAGVAAAAITILFECTAGNISVDCTQLEPGTISSKWTPDTSWATETEVGEVLLAPLGSVLNDEGNRVIQANDPRLEVRLTSSNFVPDSNFDSGLLVAEGDMPVGVLNIPTGIWVAAETIGDTEIITGSSNSPNITGPNHLLIDPIGGVAEGRVWILMEFTTLADRDYVFSIYAAVVPGGLSSLDLLVTLRNYDENGVIRETPLSASIISVTSEELERYELSFSTTAAPFEAVTAAPYRAMLLIQNDDLVTQCKVDAVQIEPAQVETPDWVPGPRHATEIQLGQVLLAPNGDATNLEGIRVVTTDDSRLVAALVPFGIVNIVFGDTPYAVGDLGTDDAIFADATGGAIDVNLPSVVGAEGRLVIVKKMDSTVNVVNLNGDGGETIDGITPRVLTLQYESLTLVCSGAEWSIV